MALFDPKKVKLGIAPIGWCNDDMPELGAENRLRDRQQVPQGPPGAEVGAGP